MDDPKPISSRTLQQQLPCVRGEIGGQGGVCL